MSTRASLVNVLRPFGRFLDVFIYTWSLCGALYGLALTTMFLIFLGVTRLAHKSPSSIFMAFIVFLTCCSVCSFEYPTVLLCASVKVDANMFALSHGLVMVMLFIFSCILFLSIYICIVIVETVEFSGPLVNLGFC